MEQEMKQKEISTSKFSYADYRQWPEDERWELIDGKAYDMTPAPTLLHQKISIALENQISNFLQNHPCQMFHAPCEVVFSRRSASENAIKTVVQPDIFVVCDRSKLKENYCFGAPDFIIEILSPSTSSKDHIKKKALYERNGVREYWLVHPMERVLIVYRLAENKSYGPSEIFAEEDMQVEVSIFPGFFIDFSKVFPSLPKIVRETPEKFRARK